MQPKKFLVATPTFFQELLHSSSKPIGRISNQITFTKLGNVFNKKVFSYVIKRNSLMLIYREVSLAFNKSPKYNDCSLL